MPQTKIAFGAFLVMSGAVAINLFAFQEKRRGRVETAALAQPAPATAETFNGGEPIVIRSGEAVSATQLAPQVASDAPAMSKAEIVRGIQRELAARGYEPGAADGVAGLVTRAAIMAYEHDNGLALTAEPSQELLGRIVLGPAVPAVPRMGNSDIRSAEAQSVVRLTAQSLAALGFKGVTASGILDDKLIKAIREFEAGQNLPETGRVSAPLVSRLVRLQGQIKPRG